MVAMFASRSVRTMALVATIPACAAFRKPTLVMATARTATAAARHLEGLIKEFSRDARFSGCPRHVARPRVRRRVPGPVFSVGLWLGQAIGRSLQASARTRSCGAGL